MNDSCTEFLPKLSGGAASLDDKTTRLTAQMHKAIAVIQFKIEGQLIEKAGIRVNLDGDFSSVVFKLEAVN